MGNFWTCVRNADQVIAQLKVLGLWPEPGWQDVPATRELTDPEQVVDRVMREVPKPPEAG